MGCVCESGAGERQFAGDKSDRTSRSGVAVRLCERFADREHVYRRRLRRSVAVACCACLRASDDLAHDASKALERQCDFEGGAVAGLVGYFDSAARFFDRGFYDVEADAATGEF